MLSALSTNVSNGVETARATKRLGSTVARYQVGRREAIERLFPVMRGLSVRAVSVPPDVRSDLAERYRQVRPFDEAEVSLVRALSSKPDRLPRRHEVALRLALNVARLWVIRQTHHDVVVGHRLGVFRDRIRPVADRLVAAGGDIDPRHLGREAEELQTQVRWVIDDILAAHQGELSVARLEEELCRKKLVLALGGGGGCGYAHLGALSLLSSLQLEVDAVVGTSIGSVLGLFFARDGTYREAYLRMATSGLRYSDVFRLLDGPTRYGIPGALQLHLRSGVERFFLREDGLPMRISDLRIPFACAVTGLQREAVDEVRPFERELIRQLRRGTLGRLLHVTEMISGLARLLGRLISRPGALQTIALGADPLSRSFDAVDAVGFSSALPSVIQYDITRSDGRMHQLVSEIMLRENVDALADGGLVANVPARIAWEMVQSGTVVSRNAFVLGFDCFAPVLGRNLLFLPLQRIAAQSVRRNRPFAHTILSLRRVPGPLAVLPQIRDVEQAFRNTRDELSRKSPYLQKMLEPLPALHLRDRISA